MRNRWFILLISFVIIASNTVANTKTDTILDELRANHKRSDKSLLYNKLSKTYTEIHIDSAIYFAKKGFVLASKTNNHLGIAENAASIGDYYIISDSLDKALNYYLLAGKHFASMDMTFDQAQIYMVIGNIYLSQNNYTNSLKFYQESQVICETNKHFKILPYLQNNIGIIYAKLEKNEKALKYYKEAYNGFKELGVKYGLAKTVSNIADIYIKDNRDTLAIDYYEEALLLFIELESNIDVASVYLDLGNYEYEQTKYNEALFHYEKSLEQMKIPGAEYLGPKSYITVNIIANIGRVNSKLGNYKLAKKYLKEALQIAYQNKYNYWIEFCTFELSEIYERQGNYVNALDYYKRYEQYGDSILNESSIQKITQLEMQFDYDKQLKEKELLDAKKEAAQQEKEFLYILFITLGVLIAVIAVLLYLNQRNKTKSVELRKDNLKLEHDNLQQELLYKNKELATNVMYLLNKNEFITSIAEKLSSAQMSFKKENQKLIQDIIREMLMNSSKDVWKEFEMRFQEVHSDFYDSLNSKYPDLTPNEKKICAFLRLNMTTKDISSITYQSVKSINMARFRLRKKLGIDTDKNLVVFLSQL